MGPCRSSSLIGPTRLRAMMLRGLTMKSCRGVRALKAAARNWACPSRSTRLANLLKLTRMCGRLGVCFWQQRRHGSCEEAQCPRGGEQAAEEIHRRPEARVGQLEGGKPAAKAP